MKTKTASLSQECDHKYSWHPFTQMSEWLQEKPLVIASGKGSWLTDGEGKKYLDANASIWTNLHGHQHPALDRALIRQTRTLAHTSFLGLTNEPAAHLGAELIAAAPCSKNQQEKGDTKLSKVFYSDDGSTATEVALKLSYEYVRRTRGTKSPRFLSLDGAYHGDTVGAVSVGQIPLFHQAFKPLLFQSDSVMSPYCYRCPFNRAKPERGDARTYRKCAWECLDQIDQKLVRRKKQAKEPYLGFIVEPLLQGAAGMIPQPEGWLKGATERARSHGSLILADEVMTGFGRTDRSALFASEKEGVVPDFLILAKGLTGGYLPMAATLTTQNIFDAFLGRYDEFKTFFHGHSYTGNPLGAAVARASLTLLQSAESMRHRSRLVETLERNIPKLWRHLIIGDIRQVGTVFAIELVKNWKTREPFPLAEQVGIRLCRALRSRGVLTRPIGNVVPFLFPYPTTPKEVAFAFQQLEESLEEFRELTSAR